ncbi:PH domain-containing protein [Klenkia sp. PcliD-1-E]|uniref:PH domain-containing protein n=1 Tax=Klenkia sp. PcliD-1-E TaxID=2954492 RepID=UPI0020969324|nr:PH domain-containing protein [Klenkia sp. PcliD-1-E]MCO7221962.1 PH domain-containing protein [Klenkia sp. PcliD-1-E]
MPAPQQWSTRPVETALAGGAALVLAVSALWTDAAGRFLVGAAALLLAVVAVRDLLLRPRLTADEDEVVVAAVGGRTVIPRDRLRARVRTGRRLGVRTTSLELEDLGDDGVLVVLGRRDLGADPEQVGAQLLGHRP